MLAITGINSRFDAVIGRTRGATLATIRHRYQSGTLENGEPNYLWGGAGHEDDEYILIRRIPPLDRTLAPNYKEGLQLGPLDRIAIFRSDSTVVDGDEVAVGSTYYKIESPIETLNLMGLTQKTAALTYMGTP